MGIINRLVLVLSVALVSPLSALAYLSNEKTPVCMEGANEIQVDNARILKFKTTTKNQYLARGYVSGTVSSPVVRKGDHDRFIIKIGPGAKDDLEVIYNVDFGAMPSVRVGESVIICGDYITSNAATERYQASPAGAIIHWVHYNPGNRSKNHEHGFVQFGSKLVGFDDAPVGAWTGKVGGGRGTPEVGSGPVTQPQAPSRTRPKPTVLPAPQPNQPNPGRVTPGSNPGSTNPPTRRWVNCRSLQECRERNPGFEEENAA